MHELLRADLKAAADKSDEQAFANLWAQAIVSELCQFPWLMSGNGAPLGLEVLAVPSDGRTPVSLLALPNVRDSVAALVRTACRELGAKAAQVQVHWELDPYAGPDARKFAFCWRIMSSNLTTLDDWKNGGCTARVVVSEWNPAVLVVGGPHTIAPPKSPGKFWSWCSNLVNPASGPAEGLASEDDWRKAAGLVLGLLPALPSDPPSRAADKDKLKEAVHTPSFETIGPHLQPLAPLHPTMALGMSISAITLSDPNDLRGLRQALGATAHEFVLIRASGQTHLAFPSKSIPAGLMHLVVVRMGQDGTAQSTLEVMRRTGEWIAVELPGATALAEDTTLSVCVPCTELPLQVRPLALHLVREAPTLELADAEWTAVASGAIERVPLPRVQVQQDWFAPISMALYFEPSDGTFHREPVPGRLPLEPLLQEYMSFSWAFAGPSGSTALVSVHRGAPGLLADRTFRRGDVVLGVKDSGEGTPSRQLDTATPMPLSARLTEGSLVLQFEEAARGHPIRVQRGQDCLAVGAISETGAFVVPNVGPFAGLHGLSLGDIRAAKLPLELEPWFAWNGLSVLLRVGVQIGLVIPPVAGLTPISLRSFPGNVALAYLRSTATPAAGLPASRVIPDCGAMPIGRSRQVFAFAGRTLTVVDGSLNAGTPCGTACNLAPSGTVNLVPGMWLLFEDSSLYEVDVDDLRPLGQVVLFAAPPCAPGGICCPLSVLQ